MYSADTDIPDIEDRRFYRIRQWWQERQPQMPPFQNHARALWRKVISRAPADAHLKLSFAEVAKCFQLRALIAQNNNSDIDWMRAAYRPGRFDRITPFAGTQDYSYVVIDEAQDLNPTQAVCDGPRRRGSAMRSSRPLPVAIRRRGEERCGRQGHFLIRSSD